ncbi:protein kinase [Micromonospora rifamycinica]|uniref:protein kinase domain-containing protein n=1 Tax=Micromonospora rifamycinica TaxID=291594 RepID=UPI0033D9E73E
MTTPAAPTTAALLVGIAAYPDEPLLNPVVDVSLMTAAVTAIDPTASITPLVDHQVTLARLQLAIRQLRDHPAPFKIFYFSGHGRTADDRINVLATVDGEPGNEGLPIQNFPDIIRQPRYDRDERWLILLDCCHPVPLDRRATGMDARAAVQMFGDVVQRRAVIAACDPLAEAADVGRSGSPFTRAVVAGLAARDTRGQTTANSLFDAVCADLAARHLPTPLMSTDHLGPFVIVDGGQPPTVIPPVEGAAREEIVAEAQRWADEAWELISPSSAEWDRTGWQRMQGTLVQTTDWFRRQEAGQPDLLRDERFQRARLMVRSRFTDLAAVRPGIRTARGTIGRELGRGGFGVVWELISPGSRGPDLAWKAYHSDRLDESERLARFARGFRAMARLKHRNIVTVQQYLEVPPAIVMELVTGGDLTNYWVDDARDRLRLLADVASALEHAHERETTHRDIKPSNVLLRPTPRGPEPVLTDFDLAYFPKATRSTRLIIDESGYTAPELADNDDPQLRKAASADVYGLGQLLFHVFTSADPRRDDATGNLRRLRKAIAGQELDPALVAAVTSLYAEATQPKASRRPTVTEVRQALLAALADTPGSTEVRRNDGAFMHQVLEHARLRYVTSRVVPRRASGEWPYQFEAESRTGLTLLRMRVDAPNGQQPEGALSVALKLVVPASHQHRRFHGRWLLAWDRVGRMTTVDPELIVLHPRSRVEQSKRIPTLRRVFPLAGPTDAEARRIGELLRRTISAGER